MSRHSVTIYVPDGDKDANEFLADCQFEQVQHSSAGNEREALRPFAAVAAVDIGSDEADGDLFSPVNHHNAPRLTVGDFRRALAALSLTEPHTAAAAGKRGMIRDHKLAQVKGWIDDPSDARAVECAKGVTDAIVLLERHGIIDWATEPQATEVSDKDLLNWIENEASRGLTEGDAREALTAIKWKIKDGR